MCEYSDKEIDEFLRNANSDLGSGKYSGDEMIPDYAKTVIICQQLQREIRELKNLEDTPLCNGASDWVNK